MIKKDCHISKDEFEELLDEFSISQLKQDDSLFRVNEFILERKISLGPLLQLAHWKNALRPIIDRISHSNTL
jgi:hypothetical protein